MTQNVERRFLGRPRGGIGGGRVDLRHLPACSTRGTTLLRVLSRWRAQGLDPGREPSCGGRSPTHDENHLKEPRQRRTRCALIRNRSNGHSTLGPSFALGGERKGNGFEERMPFNAKFHFSHTICGTTKSHEHVGRFALKSMLSSTIPIVYIQKYTHCDRLQRKNQSTVNLTQNWIDSSSDACMYRNSVPNEES